MSPFKVSFENMEWQQIRPDVRQKVYCEGSRQIRLVEFDTSDGAEHWCESGHSGYVLKGGLDISFDGNVISFKAGDGLFIPSGAASQPISRPLSRARGASSSTTFCTARRSWKSTSTSTFSSSSGRSRGSRKICHWSRNLRSDGFQPSRIQQRED